MRIEMTPVGFVKATRTEATDDDWGGTESVIELADHMPDDAILGLSSFSHLELVYLFDRVDPATTTTGARHPRNNPDWPKVGIFAQRAKNRPNRMGVSIVRVVKVEGRRVVVAELDAIDGTPVLDIKPVLREFLPRGAVVQPDWATELMRDYFNVVTPTEGKKA